MEADFVAGITSPPPIFRFLFKALICLALIPANSSISFLFSSSIFSFSSFFKAAFDNAFSFPFPFAPVLLLPAAVEALEPSSDGSELVGMVGEGRALLAADGGTEGGAEESSSSLTKSPMPRSSPPPLPPGPAPIPSRFMTSLFPSSISSFVVGTAGAANSLPEDASSFGWEGLRRAARLTSVSGGGCGKVDGSERERSESREDRNKGGHQVGTEREISARASDAADRVSYNFERRWGSTCGSCEDMVSHVQCCI